MTIYCILLIFEIIRSRTENVNKTEGKRARYVIYIVEVNKIFAKACFIMQS